MGPAQPGNTVGTETDSFAAVETPVEFAMLTGWQDANLAPALEAFKRSCSRILDRALDASISERAPYAGTALEWRPACESANIATDSASARAVFEAMLVPVEIRQTDGDSRFTGYFEPTIAARRIPEFPYTQPVPGLPSDYVQVDPSVFGRPAGRKVPAQRQSDGSLRPYPPRSEIAQRGDNALGYAHPADVFFLQIQGSGRLEFADGSSIRAAYAAHNAQPFGSVANYLMNTGKIGRGEATMQGIRAWMDRVSRAEAQAAMNQNPRFVFFRSLPIGDSNLGPEGAALVPLTPLGSMAIDPTFHPFGVPFFVQTNSPGLGGEWAGLLVAQDTGGAIKGKVRGDIYFGTGSEAGAAAGRQNAPGKMWALLPRPVAKRLLASPTTPSS
ncbi:MAG: MltA domain-containing protein [Pseudomonadota bacterium]